MHGLLDDDDIQRLRDALISADYTSDGIAARLGDDALSALKRNDHRAALKATDGAGDDALATLIRLYVCGQTESEARVRHAFRGVRDPSALLIAADGGYRAGIDLEPYIRGTWILSDVPRPDRSLRTDHVLGVGGASTSLANATIREPVGRALDLGTGCGVQALHLSEHADHVVATDLSERALMFAATTAKLAGRDWDLRQGDMIEPVRGERFDLVVSNPPFVAGPASTSYTYRDSGRAGDGISAELARSSPDLLNPGGTLQFLANWLHVTGEDWADRVAGWFAGTGMDAWVIQREVSDPMAYVDLWLNDAAEAGDPHRAAAWLDWFDEHRVEAIGFGLVTVKNNQHHDPVVRVETLRQPLAQPFGPEIVAWFDRQAWLRDQSIDALLDSRYATAEGLRLHQEADRAADGWDVTQQVLVQTRGLGWSEEIDPVLLAIVSGSDGQVSLRDQVAVLAAAYDEPVSTLNMMAAMLIPGLVERGFLVPATSVPIR